MKTMAAREGRLPAAQPAPVQVWRFGPALHGSSPPTDLTLIGIGGEVVVDYAIRLAGEYPTRRIWAAGYSNDVFGYLPSRRVLLEGGYEGADAMVYYGRPGPFAPNVEELIIGQIRRLGKRCRHRPARGYALVPADRSADRVEARASDAEKLRATGVVTVKR